jgi:hypothetical protein
MHFSCILPSSGTGTITIPLDLYLIYQVMTSKLLSVLVQNVDGFGHSGPPHLTSANNSNQSHEKDLKYNDVTHIHEKHHAYDLMMMEMQDDKQLVPFFQEFQMVPHIMVTT